MAKKNNALILKIIFTLVVVAIVAIFSAGGFYMLTGFRLNAVESNIENIKEIDLTNIEGDIEFHDDRLYEQEKEVFGLKKEFGHLAEKVDRNFKDQKDFQIEQRVIQEEILEEIKGLQR